MLKVLLSVTLAQAGKTGIYQYLVGLLEGFRQAELPVHFTLVGFEPERALFEPFLNWASWVGLSRQCGPVRDLLWHQLCLQQLADRHGVELIHIPSYRRSLIHSRQPQVVTVHDCLAINPQKYGFLRSLLARWMLRAHVHRSHGVIAVSQSTRDALAALVPGLAKKMTVVHNGVRPDFYPADETRRDLVYVSRLEHPAKNHLNLIDGYERFRRRSPRSPRLVLVGERWNGYQCILERVERSPFARDIEVTGFWAGSLAGLYQRSSALIYPSLGEGFGLPLVEAMACGCPVFCSDIPVFHEVAGPAAAFFLPEDPESIASCLQQNLQPGRLEQLSRLGLRWAEKYRWTRAAHSTYGVYRSCLG